MQMFRAQITAPDEPYHYVGSKLKRFIVWLVIGVHVSIIVIPGLVMALIAWLKPQEVLVSKVVLVDSLPNDNTIPSHNPGPAPTPSNDPPAPPSDLPDIPDVQEVPAPTPPTPTPPQPKPTPKPQPKPQPKPTPKPQPKPAWKPLDAKQIKIQPGERTPVRSGQQQTRQSSNTNLFQLASDIRSAASTPGGAGGPKGQYSPNANDYYMKVGAYLRSKWVDQPSVSALGGQRPVVHVTFNVAPNGRIISTRIVRRSGNSVMDSSVERFLKSLTVIPAPPKNLRTFTVTMRIED